MSIKCFFFLGSKNTFLKDKNGKKVELEQSDDSSKVSQYEIFYKELRNNSIPTGGAFSFDKVSFQFLY